MSKRAEERIGPQVSQFRLAWPLVIGAVLVVSGVVVGIAVPGAGTIAGILLLIVWVGGAYLFAGWGEAQNSATVVVRDQDDRFVIRDRFGRSRRVAWRSVVHFSTTDDGVGFAHLRDGSSVRLFAARRIDSGVVIATRRDEIHASVSRLSAILEERHGPLATLPPPAPLPAPQSRAGVQVLDGDLVIGLNTGRVRSVGFLLLGIVILLEGVVEVATDHSSGEVAHDIAATVPAGLLLWLGWQLAKQPVDVLVREHDDVFLVRDGLRRARPVAWRSVARFRASEDGVGFVDLHDGSSVRLFSGCGRRVRGQVGELVADLDGIRRQRGDE
jgi:hypothetical protein